MIDLVKEKECKLSSQEVFDIINFALQTAESNGYLNSYVFERALYLYAADVLYPERKEEIVKLVIESPFTAWDALVKDGTIEKMLEEFSLELEIIAINSERWFEEFSTYSNSARGLLDNLQMFTGEIVDTAVQKFQEIKQSGADNIINFGEKWGIDANI